ncbi:hypothetical protein GCM10022226_10760 [Sphaerisporangium flaviroseum]|uniref:Uncharacterized protein n=1 Tax=Sphaerisporangium flaviroseum TaxID=509199 RepID=A0ABP7HLB2_9ACTN
MRCSVAHVSITMQPSPPVTTPALFNHQEPSGCTHASTPGTTSCSVPGAPAGDEGCFGETIVTPASTSTDRPGAAPAPQGPDQDDEDLA